MEGPHVQGPGARLIAAAAAAPEVVDGLGRRLGLRRMTMLDKLRLFKAAGPVLAQNAPWMGIALLACSVVRSTKFRCRRRAMRGRSRRWCSGSAMPGFRRWRRCWMWRRGQWTWTRQKTEFAP